MKQHAVRVLVFALIALGVVGACSGSNSGAAPTPAQPTSSPKPTGSVVVTYMGYYEVTFDAELAAPTTDRYTLMTFKGTDTTPAGTMDFRTAPGTMRLTKQTVPWLGDNQMATLVNVGKQIRILVVSNGQTLAEGTFIYNPK